MTKKELEARVKILEEWDDTLYNLLVSVEQYLAGQALGEYVQQMLIKYVQEVMSND